MTMQQFIRKHRAEIDAEIRGQCDNLGRLNDEDREDWIINYAAPLPVGDARRSARMTVNVEGDGWSEACTNRTEAARVLRDFAEQELTAEKITVTDDDGTPLTWRVVIMFRR